MKSPIMFRTTGTLSLAALSFFLLCGDTAPQSCQPVHIGPTGGQIAAGAAVIGAVVVGTVVLVHVHNEKHRVKGCVTMGPSGLELRTDDNKTYALDGDMKDVKAGDKVKIHGSKIKKAKDATGDQTFTVEKLNKDYGHCTTTPSTASGVTR